jgi:hypothetical protein
LSLGCRQLADRPGIACPEPPQALTTSEAQEQATILRVLLQMQCGNGLMHESVSTLSRPRLPQPVGGLPTLPAVAHPSLRQVGASVRVAAP